MPKKDRSRDDRRSVGSHDKMLKALGKAALSNAVQGKPNIETLSTWVKPESVRATDSVASKVDKQYNRGLITTDERAEERVTEAVKNKGFHKGF